jgi:hypothetical protein
MTREEEVIEDNIADEHGEDNKVGIVEETAMNYVKEYKNLRMANVTYFYNLVSTQSLDRGRTTYHYNYRVKGFEILNPFSILCVNNDGSANYCFPCTSLTQFPSIQNTFSLRFPSLFIIKISVVVSVFDHHPYFWCNK